MRNWSMKLMADWTPKTVIMVAGGAIGVLTAAVLVPWMLMGDTARARVTPTEQRWIAVAPGRIEPASGDIKIAAPIAGVVGEVLVKVNDKVQAGEPLIRLRDNEVLARLGGAEMQVAARKRARNDTSVSGKAHDRRKAEDAVAEAERAIVETRAAHDKVVLALRAGNGSQEDVDAARTALQQAQEKLAQQKAALRKVEADAPLPAAVDGQLNVARSELLAAEAAAEKLIIRAPIAGSVLQLNIKRGELAMPSVTQPLVLIGDVSALRVRAELDERDFGGVKVGQEVVVRSTAFQGRDFVGKVSFIAPLVEQGRGGLRGPRGPSDVDVVEALVDLKEANTLTTGMKVDVYFGR
jgi:HlyD family secretion protein